MVSAASRSRGAQLAGRYLSDLLLHDYRNKWIVLSERTRANQVNYLAVAKVLAAYVERNPTASRGYGTSAEKIKDVVHRALTAKLMSRETLELAIAAFDMSDANARTLFELWDETTPPRALIGDLPSLDVPKAAYKGARQFETVSRQELHYVGSDGLANHHRTIQVIRACVDNYATHRYVFDTDEVEVMRIRGGTPSEPYSLKDSIWAVDIKLPRVMSCGDATPIEFETRFLRPETFEPCFRYAAHQRLERVVFRVEFDVARLPRNVWWTEWKDYREPNIKVNHRTPLALDVERGVQHYLDVLEHAVCGFSWEF